jgi:hypothetical protein
MAAIDRAIAPAAYQLSSDRVLCEALIWRPLAPHAVATTATIAQTAATLPIQNC